MRRLQRLARIARWAAAAACFALIVLNLTGRGFGVTVPLASVCAFDLVATRGRVEVTACLGPDANSYTWQAQLSRGQGLSLQWIPAWPPGSIERNGRRSSIFLSAVATAWVIALVLLGPDLFQFARRVHRRHSQGRCRCGYDLRGLDTGLCPECGLQAGRGAP